MRKTCKRTWARAVTLVVAVFFVMALSSSVVDAQVTRFYGRGYYGPNSDLNYCSFYITMRSPEDQTVYVDTLPLEFNLTWTEYPNFGIPGLYGDYAYSVDGGPFVGVTSTPSSTDVFYQTPKNNFTLNPTFSTSVDISQLENGTHTILIFASLFNQNVYPPIYPPSHLFFNMTTSPYKFQVGEQTATTNSPTPSPPLNPLIAGQQNAQAESPEATSTPAIPEFPALAILPLFIALTLTAIVLLRRKLL